MNRPVVQKRKPYAAAPIVKAMPRAASSRVRHPTRRPTCGTGASALRWRAMLFISAHSTGVAARHDQRADHHLHRLVVLVEGRRPQPDEPGIRPRSRLPDLEHLADHAQFVAGP